MKKVLYGTSALVAAGLLISSPALAQESPSLSISGFLTTAFGFTNQDDGAGEPGDNLRNHAFAQDSEIHFTARTELDNGVRVTVAIELEGEGQNDQIDETYIRFASDAWGEVVLGNRDGAASKMSKLGPLVTGNYIVGCAQFTHVNFGTNDIGGLCTQNSIDGSDSLKISYFTPVFSGVRFGISYEPEPGLDGDGQTGGGLSADSSGTTTAAGQQSEIISMGAEYVGNFNDVSFNGSVTYGTGSQEETALAGEFLDDRSQWQAGVTLGFGAFAIGGAYKSDQVNSDVRAARQKDDVTWRVAATYRNGDWTIGAGFANRTLDDETVVGGSDEVSVWGFTLSRTLGPGISVAAGIRVFDLTDDDNAIGAENSATNIFVKTGLSF